MSISRKEFFRKGCISGACLCGFGSMNLFAKNSVDGTPGASLEDGNIDLVQDWITSLISNMGADLDDEILRKVIKKSAIVHYESLKMDELLSDYVGDMESFVHFIEDKWGWKIDYSKENKILIADENKNNCVCPILNNQKETNSSAMCYCSEGFAEKMFSKVAGVPVTATVASSIRRGDKRCVYKIVFP